MVETKVVLIGGTSGAGKTTLGRALAAKLGIASLTVDDLQIAARAVTTPESHPGLHVMNIPTAHEYFTSSTVDELTADATAQHEAMRPAIERVVRVRANSGPSIVIDGWYMRPRWMGEMDFENVVSFWIVADPAVLEARERVLGKEWMAQSSDPERMFQNFLGRSLWYNDLIRRQAEELGHTVLHQDGSVSVEEMCDMALSLLERDG